MKITLKDITDEGLEFMEVVKAENIGLLEEDLKCLSPLTIRVTAARVENTILVKTEVQGKYAFFCARCLEPIEYSNHQIFDFDYLVGKGREFIELDEDIRQEMIISIPARVLCQEDCKGICVRCGINLNKEGCRCQR